MNQPDHNSEEILRWLITRCDIKSPAPKAAAMSLAQAGIDSLEIVSISMDLEDQFGLRINLEKLASESTLKDIVAGLVKAQ